MKNSGKSQFRNYELPIRGYPETSPEDFKAFLKPTDISPGRAEKILTRLNSFNSPEQLRNTVQTHTRQSILSTGDAQRILRNKAKLGAFHDLQQVAIVLRIGAKKFDLIVRALDD